GRLADAERLAQQASQIAKTDLHKAVVRRFRSLTELTRGWVERNGYLDADRTNTASEAVIALYTEEENTVRRRFNAQMPAQDTYLKAMGKGLVDVYGMHATAAQRVLFIDYVLQGAIDAHEGAFDNVDFWVEACARALPDKSADHPALKTMLELRARRTDLIALGEMFDSLGGPDTIAELEALRDEFDEHPRAKIIAESIHALREVENALPDWANAEFRTAGMKLEKAVKSAQAGSRAAQVDMSGYIGWLRDMAAAAAELHTAKRDLTDLIETRPDYPDPALRALHDKLVDLTVEQVGDEYTATLKLWRDTYVSFADVMGSNNRRSAKLAAFNDLFRAMFIDRHPAYPVYRHWFDMTERAPEFPAPPTDDPQPRLTEDEPLPVAASPAYDDIEDAVYDDDEADYPARPRRRSPLTTAVFVLVGLALLAAGGLIASQFIGGGNDGEIAVTISPTPTGNATGTAIAVARADNTATAEALALVQA
ncbi:MAG: hypothetical protein AAF125_22450, partial [Chloroflexota bacterium]